jgi:uncharacterized protein
MITEKLIQVILQQYPLRPDGIHGVAHWARVLENGRRLAQENDVRIEVVELFAVFHDSQRQNDHHDPQHGLRGAALAAKLRGASYELDDEGFDLLFTACAHHTDGLLVGNATLQICWDSDRLDLGRVWIKPNPHKLCTEAARNHEMITWANSRSRIKSPPPLVLDEWGLRL